jgi:hypothetical protein
MKSFLPILAASILTLQAGAFAQSGMTPSVPSTPAPAAPATPATQVIRTVDIGDGYRFTVETTEAPDLTEWSDKELIPALKKWYPEIVKMLPSDGYKAPKTFAIIFTTNYKGVAATMGNRIEGNPEWYRKELKREAIGSMVHELVHVVQQYGRARQPGATKAPGWLVEGLADYIRWYLYEPQSKGCEINQKRAATVKYDNAYRVTANFLNYVIAKYDKDLIKELNTAMREGKYDAEVWKKGTGKTVEELGEEWKKALEEGKGV